MRGIGWSIVRSAVARIAGLRDGWGEAGAGVSIGPRKRMGGNRVTGGENINYTALGLALKQAGLISGVAELHGCVCGLLCSGGGDASERWLDECLKDAGGDLETVERLRARLNELGIDAWRTLAGGELGFEPLLPHDEMPLEERVHALAEWCQGFLAGLGLGGLDPQLLDDRGRDAITEIFNDFSEISRAVLEDDSSSESAQPDFSLVEVVEYVRVSVQIVFEELAAVRTKLDQRTLH